MAKKLSKKIIEVDAQESEAQEPEPTQEDFVYADRLAQFRSIAGESEYRLRAQIYSREGHTWEVIDSYPLSDDFDPVNVMKEYGTGKYRFSLIDDRGRYVSTPDVAGSFTLTFRASPRKPGDEIKPQVSPLQDPTVQMMFQVMKDSQAQTLEILKASMTNPKGESLSSQLELLLKMRSLVPEQQNPLDMMDKLVRLMNSIKEKAERGEPETGWASDLLMVKKIAEEFGIADKLKAMTGKPQALTAPQEVVQNPPAPPVQDIKEYFRPYARALVKLAKEENDPRTGADFLIDQLELMIVPKLSEENGVPEDVVWEKIIAEAKNQQSIENVFQIYLELVPHMDWVKSVIMLAVKACEEEEAAPDPEPVITTNGRKPEPVTTA